MVDVDDSEQPMKTQKWWIYVMYPLDEWVGWAEAKESDPEVQEALKALRYREVWEGDIQQGPYIRELPGGEYEAYGPQVVGVKQLNNGTAFFVSPVELPWLKDYEAR
jgi:hypothetical protein